MYHAHWLNTDTVETNDIIAVTDSSIENKSAGKRRNVCLRRKGAVGLVITLTFDL